MFSTGSTFWPWNFKSLFKTSLPKCLNYNLHKFFVRVPLESSWRDEANGTISRSNFSISWTCKSRGQRLKMTYMSIFNQWEFATHFLKFVLNSWSNGLLTNDHDMRSATDPLDLITNAFWLSSNGPHLFLLFSFSNFYILIVLNFKKS